MKKIVFVIFVFLLSACGSKGVSIVNELGKENNLKYETDVFQDGTKWYKSEIPKENAGIIADKIKNSIDKKMGMLPTVTSEKQRSSSDNPIIISDDYKWETPKMEFRMRYSKTFTTSSDKQEHYVIFWVTDK